MTPPGADGADTEMMYTAPLPRMQSSGNPLPVSTQHVTTTKIYDWELPRKEGARGAET